MSSLAKTQLTSVPNNSVGQNDDIGEVKKASDVSIYSSEELALMAEFYVCGRKTSYALKSAAVQANVSHDMNVYMCAFCTGYHLGHPSRKSNSAARKEIMHTRYVSTWKRYGHKVNRFLREKNLADSSGTLGT